MHVTAPTSLDLPDSAATDALGTALGRALLADPQASVLYLRGELGAGKTTCARSLLRAVGVQGPIRSPTYTLLDTYLAGGLVCLHVDLYRLQGRGEVEELGLRDLIGPSTLLLIEWPERGFGGLPPSDVELDLGYAGEARFATLAAPTGRGRAWLSELVLDTSLSPYVSNLT
ncbi:MAG TPA: tRNA (adenosine(37)-N6)-threonylcarbamoyltransferase complex ATPase subunit type 1 TsaE [Steroidobacteraceae bacterium]|jgi:tRNA threonylcarbamoyladenosine biosynthesis protein TsaE|nr:tRNA (adenosine(37)-N6)-threonylcarbamoyltransferase complex ATPase subunit type 1 TsaE [Steroidobacteraceae bacterium]